MLNFSDAIAITGATTGKVISEASVSVANLTAPQRTALLAFINSLGFWPGQAAHITSLSVSRTPINPNQMAATVTGLLVHADAGTAVAQQTAGAINGIIGIVP